MEVYHSPRMQAHYKSPIKCKLHSYVCLLEMLTAQWIPKVRRTTSVYGRVWSHNLLTQSYSILPIYTHTLWLPRTQHCVITL